MTSNSSAIQIPEVTSIASELAKKPTNIAETGLPQSLLEDLISRTLLESGVTDLQHLTAATALSGPVVEAILTQFRGDGRLEVKGPQGDSRSLRYGLTDAGKVYAKDAFLRSGYVGAAPVSLEHYQSLVLEQSVHKHGITRSQVTEAFDDVIIKSVMLDQLGAAMHSGKAVFIYGPPGTGKTYICQRLARLLGDPVLIPHAVAVGDSIVRVFDALLHRPVSKSGSQSSKLFMSDGHDPRFELCDRPFICSGGELTADLLEIQYDASTRQLRAPLQLKASNGIYLIDDLGRQKMPTAQLFNRWIVPMESKEDYLNMPSGNRMIMPFDLILMFSTNLNPNDLADAAFLRRIGHKIRFEYLDKAEYRRIWKEVCDQRQTPYDENLVEYVLEELHQKRGVPLLACHPRDLIGIALDFVNYDDQRTVLDIPTLEMAWDSNFVKMSNIEQSSVDDVTHINL